MKEIKQTIGSISDLTPSTLYCVKVQAFSVAYNKSSHFSKEECIKTPGGRNSLGIVTPLEGKLLTLYRRLQVSLVKKHLQHELMASQSWHLVGQRSKMSVLLLCCSVFSPTAKLLLF